MILFYKRHNTSLVKKRQSFVVLAIIALCWAGYSVKHLATTVAHSQPLNVIHLTSIDQWWQHSPQITPLFRKTRLGRPGLPLNVQWAGQLNHINQVLHQQGWTKTHSKGWKYNVLRFSNKNPIYHLPVLRQLYHHQAPTITLIKRIPKAHAILELRLWQAKVAFTDSSDVLLIGTVKYHLPIKHWLARHHTQVVFWQNQQAIESLLTIAKHQQYKIIQRQGLDVLMMRTNRQQ